MWKNALLLLLLTALPALCACGGPTDAAETPTETEAPAPSAAEIPAEVEGAEPEREENQMQMKIGGAAVQVLWEENESVAALQELVEQGPLTIRLSMYGGFEQVGPIGQALPRSDVPTTTAAGDIVLYTGDQIVVFYGSNSWDYTRLGRIADKTVEEMKALLGGGDVELTLSMEAE